MLHGGDAVDEVEQRTKDHRSAARHLAPSEQRGLAVCATHDIGTPGVPTGVRREGGKSGVSTQVEVVVAIDQSRNDVMLRRVQLNIGSCPRIAHSCDAATSDQEGPLAVARTHMENWLARVAKHDGAA